MNDIFKTVSGGIARFVFAWVLPTLISAGLFTLFVLPGIRQGWLHEPLTPAPLRDSWSAPLIFGFGVLMLSTVQAYAALPIYQVLEGYRLPKQVQKFLRRRQLREYERLRHAEARFRATNQLPSGVSVDDFTTRYPRDPNSVRATRLGNALTTMEHWSRERYHLDSQTMWHELIAVTSDNVRRDIDEARAPVDFYISAIANMTLLAPVAVAVGLTTNQRQALVVGVLALASIPYSYRSAVRNTLDWSQSVKAMVNISRHSLADAMGLALPRDLVSERHMWSAHLHTIELANDAHIESYNSFRSTGRELTSGAGPGSTSSPSVAPADEP